ncbi:MAG: glycosyltransferase, partial [Micromonosporaceae bacterium]|nr:glycosyltransferase [Micromonosporaceae bacterium]
MRIAQIANFYAPTSGGLRIAVEEAGRGYVAAGHERVLIVPGPAGTQERTAAGWRVVVPGPRLPGLGHYRVLRRRRIRRLLDEWRPDVLEVSDKVSLQWLARWARRRRVRVVLFSHERLDAILRPWAPAWFPLRAAADAANRRLARLADQVVVTSRFSAAEFLRAGAPNLLRVPLGVDLDTFRPAAPPEPAFAEPGYAEPAARVPAAAVPGTESTVRLIMVSRLSREKQPERAIEAIRILRARGVPARLLVLGDGPMRNRLRRRSIGLPVTFLGHIAGRRDLAQLVAGCDAALLPSPVESFGLATLEALACGTPVVGPAAGAAGELLGEP